MRTAHEARPGGGSGFWPAIADPDAGPRLPHDSTFADWAVRLGEAVSPTLAAELLRRVCPGVEALLGRERVQQARMRNRFLRARYGRCLDRLNAAGYKGVVLGDTAAAYLLYDDPDARIAAHLPDARAGGHLDVLIRPGSRDAIVFRLTQDGYRALPRGARRRGDAARSSVAALLSPDGALGLDLHVHADSLPVRRAVPTDEVFGQARPSPSGSFLLPALEHLLLLHVSAAAKTAFGPAAARPVVDGMVLLRDHGARLDWGTVAIAARRGRLGRPLTSYLALLLALGLPQDRVPPPLNRPPKGLAGREFARLAAAWRTLFAEDGGHADRRATVRRTWLLAAEPEMALVHTWRHLRGPAGGKVN